MEKRNLVERLAALFIILWVAGVVPAQAPSLASAAHEAEALYQAQKWPEAEAAYQSVVKADPADGRAWYRLGFSLFSQEKYEQATGAFQEAVNASKEGPGRPLAMYGLASSYARMNNRERALEWLDAALKANLPQPRQIKDDPNLASLRTDSRFKAVVERAEKAARVCMNLPEYRQFDFWVGEWTVVGPGGQQVGTNDVRLLEDGCIVEENWTSAQGGQTGKSFNFYNPVTRKWHQSYMGNDAGNWMMDGELAGGAMRFEGAIYSPRGKVLTRMTFFNLGSDKVRQLGENSNDGGRTWTTVWDAMYLRKK